VSDLETIDILEAFLELLLLLLHGEMVGGRNRKSSASSVPS
jgi:hypothetical protein